MQKVEVSIIIVYFSGYKFLKSLINSITDCKTKCNYEIIVVDNSNEINLDKLLTDQFKGIQYIKSKRNIGYGAGNNLGVSRAKGEYILILNPDTVILPHTIDYLVNFLNKHKQCAIAAPVLTDRKGNIVMQTGLSKLTPLMAIFTHSFINKLLPGNPISKKYWAKKDRNNKNISVEVVPGSAFMVRKKSFVKVGMFDERLFLYFEEQDLCNRIKKSGYQIYIIPSAKVIHNWKGNSGNNRLKDYFSKSRYYYFKKHFGILNALLVEVFTRFSKYSLLIIVLTILGYLIRIYKLPFSFPFTAEVGDNLLEIKNYYFNHYLPLVGPPTSHPWLKFGPFFYWIYGPVLVLSSFNPISYAYFGALVATLVIPLNFYTVRILFNKSVALISTILITFSPLYLLFSLNARFFNFISVLIYPFILFLYKALFINKKYFKYLSFTIGVMFSFHYTPIFLIPVVIILIFYRKIRFTPREVFLSLFYLLLPLTPLFIYDVRNHFQMLSNLILWIPYRLLGFIGIYPKNNPTLISLKTGGVTILQFLVTGFTQNVSMLGVFISILLVAYTICRLLLIYRTRKIPGGILIIFTMFFSGIISLVIHGEPPIHYFLPIFPIPIIIFSLFLSDMLKKPILRLFVIFILILISLLNIRNTVIQRLYYEKLQGISKDPYFVPLKLQQQISGYIVEDAKGSGYILNRVGIYDYFEGDFAQNYQYLLWLYGNEPAVVGNKVIDLSKNPIIRYTIIEDVKGVNYLENVRVFGGVIISKSQVQ